MSCWYLFLVGSHSAIYIFATFFRFLSIDIIVTIVC